MNKSFFELGLIVSSDVWGGEADFERGFHKFLNAEGLEANRIKSPGRMVLEIRQKQGFAPAVPEKQDPNVQVQQKPRQELNSFLENYKKAKEAGKPKLKILKDSLL